MVIQGFRIVRSFKFFFARARTHAFEVLLNRDEKSTRFIAIGSLAVGLMFFSTWSAASKEPTFLKDSTGHISGVATDDSQEQSTRQKMKILNDCQWIKTSAKALPLLGSDDSRVIPHLKSQRGVLILEGRREGSDWHVLDTELLNAYKNYPTSIFAEQHFRPSPQYTLAITFTASLPGKGDWVIHKGESLIIKADNQLYAYYLPEMKISSDGLLKVYPGTDDTLYYDAALTHPVHSGTCRSKKK